MVESERIRVLNDLSEGNGEYVLYWMQAAQRYSYNHALEYAIRKANELNLPVLVYFGLTDEFPEANLRHYRFMLEGLIEAGRKLAEMGIKLVVVKTDPPTGALRLSTKAAVTVVDRGYLRVERDWRKEVAREINTRFVEVETNLVVPVEEASDKEEYAAYTIRPKINEKLDKYMVEMEHSTPELKSLGLDVGVDSVLDSGVDGVLENLNLDRSVGPVSGFAGGYSHAKENLDLFIEDKLDGFSDYRNDPGKNYLSELSPYLHFGQISPLEIAIEVGGSNEAGVDDFLEELIVRRELSFNFVHYNDHYDSLWKVIPGWAEETLKEHEGDSRDYTYSYEEFENSETHDPYWNAAQTEMVITGKMHGYMRMYWVKKILQWSEGPERAYKIALALNNKYELDGRDPNGFAGVAWCFGKHDRAWQEREVLGKVRYMSAGGLERKFSIEDYVERVERLEA